MKVKLFIMMFVVALMTMGFECVNDGALFSVNLQGISGTYKVNQGGTTFDETVVIQASDYLDDSFSNIDLSTARIYDIRITTNGTFSGNVNGQVHVNGVQILSYNGPWSGFNTAQSLVTSPLLSRNAAGISALVSAIKSQQNITLRGFGTLSQTAPSGLSVSVEIFGQVDSGL